MHYHRLTPPIPLETPKGFGWGYFLVDGGLEHDDYWKVLINETGEWWTFANQKVRGVRNYTLDRIRTTVIALDKAGVQAVHRVGCSRPGGPSRRRK